MKFYFSTRLGGKRRAGVPGYGVPGCGKHGVWWKTRGVVEKTGCGGKDGVWWKTRGLVEKTGGGGKHGVWKTRGLVENRGKKVPFFSAKHEVSSEYQFSNSA